MAGSFILLHVTLSVVKSNKKSAGIKLSAKKLTLKQNATKQLKATLDKNATDKVTWSSSNKKVATVDKNGVVTAVKKGTVTITAKTSGGKKATCKVTDADHIGGMDVVLYKFDCKTIIMPDVANNTRTYDDVVQTMKNKGYKTTYPVVGETYTIGGAAFTIIAPNKEYGNDMNSWSVGVLLQNGNHRFLFTGDAEEGAEQDILQNGIDISADVYKVAHHGSNTATSQAFLDAVHPTYAVISAGEGNSYGHPHAEVLNRLRAAGVSVFRTDEQGTIVASSDGTTLTWNMSPSESWQAGEAKKSQNTEKSEKAADSQNNAETDAAVSNPTDQTDGNSDVIVHITKTGEKYHSAGCQYLRKSDIEVTLSEAKARGLTPCSKCNPPQ